MRGRLILSVVTDFDEDILDLLDLEEPVTTPELAKAVRAYLKEDPENLGNFDFDSLVVVAVEPLD